MPILQLPTRPPRDPETNPEASGGQPLTSIEPVRVRAGQYGEFGEHELIHLLDSIDDERARARFRESVYISIIIWLAVAWFLFYGPHVLFHVPYYRNPITVMKDQEKELTYVTPIAPRLPTPPPKIDRKALEALRQQELQRQVQAPPAPQPAAPQPQPQPQPQQEAHNVLPPVAQPPLPLPAAPKPSVPSAPLPAAPAPNFAHNDTPQSDLQRAMKGAIASRGGGINAPSSSGPLQAGATILSDTQGVDFTEYMRKLRHDVQRNWEPLIPEEVEPPLLKRGVVGIRFSILPDGQIGDMKLITTSGDVALDKAAWYAITSEGQFPRLPAAFHGPDLELQVGFFYNEPIQQ